MPRDGRGFSSAELKRMRESLGSVPWECNIARQARRRPGSTEKPATEKMRRVVSRATRGVARIGRDMGRRREAGLVVGGAGRWCGDRRPRGRARAWHACHGRVLVRGDGGFGAWVVGRTRKCGSTLAVRRAACSMLSISYSCISVFVCPWALCVCAPAHRCWCLRKRAAAGRCGAGGV